MAAGSAVFALLVPHPAGADDGIRLDGAKAWNAGTLRRTVNLVCEDGQVIQRAGAAVQSGSLKIEREEIVDMSAPVTKDGGVTRFRLTVPKSVTKSTLNWGARDDPLQSLGELTGKAVTGRKLNEKWTLAPEDGRPTAFQEEELGDLASYANRALFPARAVKAGDTWEFDATHLCDLLLKEQGLVTGAGTMTLEKVEKTEEARIARLKFTAESKDVKRRRHDPRLPTVKVSLTGTLRLSLETFLEEETRFEAKIRSTYTGKSGVYQTILPVTVTIREKLVVSPRSSARSGAARPPRRG